METSTPSDLNRGIRSAINLVAISLFFAYVSAYLLIFFLPTYVVFLAPVVLVYFIAPKFKRPLTQQDNTPYRNGRLIGIGIGLAIGVSGFIYGLGPLLEAVNSGTVGDGSSVASSSIGILANTIYIITLLVSYFRSK
jgi:hypothetical protein